MYQLLKNFCQVTDEQTEWTMTGDEATAFEGETYDAAQCLIAEIDGEAE